MFSRFHKVAFLALLLALGLATVADAQPRRTGPSRRVHIIVAGLTDDPNTGKSVEYNINQVKHLLETGLADAHIGEVKVLRGSAASARNLLATVDAMRPGPNDTLFMYFHGHGAYDPSRKDGDRSGGHFLAIPSGDLMRRDLWQHLLARKAKLTVLVTETCNVRGSVHPLISDPAVAVRPRGTHDSPVLASLLLNHDGAIDINAAAKDEYSWNFAVGHGGSFFTDTFVRVAEEGPFASPGKVSWMQFIKVVADRANNIYKKARSDVLAHPDRFNAETVRMYQGQLEQRAAVFHMSFTAMPTGGGAGPVVTGPSVTGDVLRIGAAGLALPGKLTVAEPVGRIRPGCSSKTYSVHLEAGRTYVIDLQSTAVDPFLVLEDPTGVRVAEDDDSGGSLNARIRFTPKASGTYRVIATTYRPALGDFMLRIGTEGGPALTLRVGAAGLRIGGKLTAADPHDAVLTRSHHKVYLVELKAGINHGIELQSRDMDPFLRVEDEAGTELARDDDSGDGLNARLEFRPVRTGVYRIIVTTYAPATGDFVLNVRGE